MVMLSNLYRICRAEESFSSNRSPDSTILHNYQYDTGENLIVNIKHKKEKLNQGKQIRKKHWIYIKVTKNT